MIAVICIACIVAGFAAQRFGHRHESRLSVPPGDFSRYAADHLGRETVR